jgi:FAD/FMN-containing dehydrogenase
MTTTSIAGVAAELRRHVTGPVLAPGDDGYDTGRLVWNGAIDRRPAYVVLAASSDDVAAAVRVARQHGLPLSVRGGGHDWAGRAVRDGGVVLDLAGLRRVDVDPLARTATAQGGARNGDLASAAHEHGLVPVTGTVNAVGLAGLTMAGGYGLMNGTAGLALDNLLSAELVLADGRLVTASPDENPDLFWAVRGGGGNFGVLTSARYRVHEVPSVQSGLVLYPYDQSRTVLRSFREVLATAPDELTVMSGYFGGPDGNPLLFLLPLWTGRPAEGTERLAQLEKLGTPVMAQLGSMPYKDILGQFDQTVVDGRHNEMRTRWLPELTDATTDAIVEAIGRWTSPLSGLYLHHFHGAAARVPVADTAFGLRRDHLLVEIVATWAPASDERHGQWSRALSADLAPHALPGGYPNLLGHDEYERVLRGYGQNAVRLLALKHRYDPDGVFRAVPTLSPTVG